MSGIHTLTPTGAPADVQQQTGLLRPALTLFALLSLITGLAYPLAVIGLAQAIFPHQANGSLVEKNGQVVGSELIGQQFGAPGQFRGRPSATAPMAYNASGSGGSNWGPSNPALHQVVEERIAALRAADPGNQAAVPVDLVTASASGLDPHISRAGADYQAARVARSRGLPEAQVRALVAAHSEGALLGLLGEPRVNVLRLNLALDTLAARPTKP